MTTLTALSFGAAMNQLEALAVAVVPCMEASASSSMRATHVAAPASWSRAAKFGEPAGNALGSFACCAFSLRIGSFARCFVGFPVGFAWLGRGAELALPSDGA